jgi:uncharacterized membrane protein YphA (DoxX/SURF4 family)
MRTLINAQLTACPPATHRRPDWALYAARCLAYCLALMWLFAGLNKLWGAAAHATEEPAAILAPSVLQQPDWARTFPIALLAAVAVIEIAAGWLILISRETRGLLVGVALLALFTGAMIAWPIPPETPCGCAGPSFELPGSPLSRLALLGGLHAFTLACLTRRES